MNATADTGPIMTTAGPLDRLGDAFLATAKGRGRHHDIADRGHASPGLAVVCDGVGGDPDAGRAADIVCAHTVAHLAGREQIGPHDLAAAVERGHAALGAAGITAATCITIAAVIHTTEGRQVLLCWAGDSPAAIVDADGRWTWVTTPDSTWQEPESVVDPAVAPRSSNTITATIRDGKPLRLHLESVPLPPGGIVIVASDGLLDTDVEPHHLVARTATPTAGDLLHAAVVNQAGDDVTVACLFPDGLDPDAPAMRGRSKPNRWWRRP